MMSIGSAQYEVWGTPYDYAYLEKKSIAIEDGLDYWLENEKEIKNDFIGTHDQADTVAVTELIWEKSLSWPRRYVIEDDPSLEPGDISPSRTAAKSSSPPCPRSWSGGAWSA
jgi:hypothetical protein